MAVESAPRPNGLKTAWDTIVAPKEAFESLRIAPTWGWAFLIVIVLTALALYLMTPANVHAVTTDWPNTVAHNPGLSAKSPEQQQAGLAFTVKITQLIWVFSPIYALIGALISTVILWIFNAIGRGQGSFGKYWAAQWNIALITSIGAIVLAVIVLARGADSFSSATEVQSAMPSLALLVPASAAKLHGFLSVFTIFGIWATGLEIAALTIIGRVGRMTAWLGGSLTIIISGLFVAASAH
jgi:hypothetical protein